MEHSTNENARDYLVARRFTEWERGILLGAVIGAFLGPSICLLIVVLLFGYDLYGPTLVYKIIERFDTSEKNESNENGNKVEEIEDVPEKVKKSKNKNSLPEASPVPLPKRIPPKKEKLSNRNSAPPLPPSNAQSNMKMPFSIPVPNFNFSIN